MSTRYFALVYGIVFLVVGIAGFFSGLKTTPMASPDLTINMGFGLLFGLFPVNILHNIVHLLFGVWGLAAYRSFGAARLYAQVVVIAYVILGIFGFIPGLNTLFGMAPLYGNDIWLHLLLAAIAAYFAFFVSRPAERHAAGTI